MYLARPNSVRKSTNCRSADGSSSTALRVWIESPRDGGRSLSGMDIYRGRTLDKAVGKGIVELTAARNAFLFRKGAGKVALPWI